jgi:hypothetical protein
MDQSHEAEAHIKLFEFLEHVETLGPKPGALLAEEDLLRSAGHFAGSKRPKGWRARVDSFARRTEDRKYMLTVFEIGDYWHVIRRTSRSKKLSFEYLALPFDEVPLCTRTEQEAMRLADHCYPNPGQTFGG